MENVTTTIKCTYYALARVYFLLFTLWCEDSNVTKWHPERLSFLLAWTCFTNNRLSCSSFMIL